MFLTVFVVWTGALYFFTKKSIKNAISGKTFLIDQFSILLGVVLFFLQIYLLSGFFNLSLVILLFLGSELSVIVRSILWGLFGSSSSKWGRSLFLSGADFGLKHRWLMYSVSMLSSLILLGSIILCGKAYFTIPPGELLTTLIFQYILIGLLFGSYPSTITFIISILVSENIDEEARTRLFVNKLSELIPTALYISLAFWAFSSAGSKTMFSISQFSIKLSTQLFIILMGFFFFTVLLPYLIGTQRAKKWNVFLLEKRISWVDKLLDIFDLPSHFLYIPRLTQFRNDLNNEINEVLPNLMKMR